MDNLTNIIDDLVTHLSTLRELGQRKVQLDPQILKDLAVPVKQVSARRQAVAATPTAAVAARPLEREALTEASLRNAPDLPLAERQQELQLLRQSMNHCFDCALCKNRNAALDGSGKIDSPDIMVIGPAPDQNDKIAGAVFSGAGGKLFDKMIDAIGYSRDSIYITNICKCPAPANGKPTIRQMKSCSHFLESQILCIKPKIILVMDEHAIKGLFHKDMSAARAQGQWANYHGIPVMTTLHPNYVLRFSDDAEGEQTTLKRSVWSALKTVKKQLARYNQANSN